MVLGKEVGELLEVESEWGVISKHFQPSGLYLVGRLGEDGLLPEVGGEVTVGLGNGGVGCLGCWKAIRETFDGRRVV